jgi:glyoxylase-like metal-dependent hydrolase (beta-lactamase superfamily II)/ferredoxin
MADPGKQVTANVSGEFFVDTTCIDCDTCRQLAPKVFGDTGDYSYVFHQPHTEDETRNALRALLACPTGSIGTRHANTANAVMGDFPLLLEEGVFYNGFNSPKSFGGNSYFIQHPEGNWLIDSPKYLPHLVNRFQAMGGIRYIFLTHQDDVADAHRYAETFGSTRIIHQGDVSAQPEAEQILHGEETVRISPEILIIPTPGHTAGHCVLLYHDRYLFTGDHLWWRRTQKALGASRSHNWYSWPQQVQSMRRLLDYSFSWVLPGHGDRIFLSQEAMRQALEDLIRRMEEPA